MKEWPKILIRTNVRFSYEHLRPTELATANQMPGHELATANRTKLWSPALDVPEKTYQIRTIYDIIL